MTDDLTVLISVPVILLTLGIIFLRLTGQAGPKNGENGYSDRTGDNLPARPVYRPKG